MIVGGYSLHLYCDNPDCAHKVTQYGETAMGEFEAWNGKIARQNAKAAGWSFKRNRKTLEETCFCPHCTKQ